MILITSDLHLTDKPKDSYRFGLFPWLEKMHRKYDVEATFILGDLTDYKDKHSAKLVNGITDALAKLPPPVYILEGNHDYIDIDNPFFGFLDMIEGITFITAPQVIRLGDGVPCLMIPHQAKFWPDLTVFRGAAEFIFIHQCIEGAIAESGARLSGLSPAPVAELGARRILAGDIHRPQLVGPVEYIGAPYTIKFGDDFVPRCVLLDVDKDQIKNLEFPTLQKRLCKIRDISELEQLCNPGDQVKIIYEMTREEYPDWPNYKRMILELCKKLELEVYGVDMTVARKKERKRLTARTVQLEPPTDTLKHFCDAESLSSRVRKEGERLLKGE
jgi:DNA repair exonuclease SbcCD nuclease subunit